MHIFLGFQQTFDRVCDLCIAMSECYLIKIVFLTCIFHAQRSVESNN